MPKKRCRYCRCLFFLTKRNPDQKWQLGISMIRKSRGKAEVSPGRLDATSQWSDLSRTCRFLASFFGVHSSIVTRHPFAASAIPQMLSNALLWTSSPTWCIFSISFLRYMILGETISSQQFAKLAVPRRVLFSIPGKLAQGS